MEKELIAVEFPKELKEEFREECRLQAQNISAVLRRLVIIWIKKQKAERQKEG